jgi:hypothetical protein
MKTNGAGLQESNMAEQELVSSVKPLKTDAEYRPFSSSPLFPLLKRTEKEIINFSKTVFPLCKPPQKKQKGHKGSFHTSHIHRKALKTERSNSAVSSFIPPAQQGVSTPLHMSSSTHGVSYLGRSMSYASSPPPIMSIGKASSPHSHGATSTFSFSSFDQFSKEALKDAEKQNKSLFYEDTDAVSSLGSSFVCVHSMRDYCNGLKRKSNKWEVKGDKKGGDGYSVSDVKEESCGDNCSVVSDSKEDETNSVLERRKSSYIARRQRILAGVASASADGRSRGYIEQDSNFLSHSSHFFRLTRDIFAWNGYLLADIATALRNPPGFFFSWNLFIFCYLSRLDRDRN